MEEILPVAFYNRPPAIVARALLGKYVVRRYKNEKLIGRIVEVEAYLPFGDGASHGSVRTKTRESLFLRAGHAYVYTMRGHCLLNTVTEGEDRPGAVLIRSIVPVCGIGTMKQLRGLHDAHNLSNGPAKLCKALSISRTFDGADLTNASSPLTIVDRGDRIDPAAITATPRIGISKAREKLLRFFI